MRISIPADLTTEPERIAYRRGWRDRAAKGAARAGSTSSTAKAAAARANGAKGGRPPMQESS